MVRKLIEVALPLEAINRAAVREKSIRHGHPSTLHLWWARRPLAAARAVIFAQMVDDPSSWPDLFPTEKAQEKERQRLFKIIEQLVQWENTTNETVLEQAREEIRLSWRRTCNAHIGEPGAEELYNKDRLPAFHDPFAGGGALPLEAQRLGLEAHASDLNPVAVLINKAMIEIPPKFANRPPVHPVAPGDEPLIAREWRGAQGLAEDVRYYGKWMRDEAERRIGHLYPKVRITAAMAKERPDLAPLVGEELTVIAWIWARTVKSPNPAFAHVDVPLASTFMLSTKPGKEAYIEPIVKGDSYRFAVRVGKPPDAEAAKRGTKISRGSFECLLSGVPIKYEYIDDEANADRMSSRMMAIVAEGRRGRIYLSPNNEHIDIAQSAHPEWRPETPSRGTWASNAQGRRYGFGTFGDYFTQRQLVSLTTYSDLVELAREKISYDLTTQQYHKRNNEITEYQDGISIYLALGVDRLVDRSSTICGWDTGYTKIRNTFSRQGIPMTWDYAEANPFSDSSGNFTAMMEWVEKALLHVPATADGYASQQDAAKQTITHNHIVSTDPPYYDNIGYADLSDYFYVWLRRSLRNMMSDLFATVSTPKADELIAAPYRHGGKSQAERFFLDGMTQAVSHLAANAHPQYPVTIYYAFKQSETDSDIGVSSTGWETFLEAVLKAGFAISGTWPMRTELANRMIGSGTNALASSIVLVCRRRDGAAGTITRRQFHDELKRELPEAVAHLQRGNIAPVDLAQASIGPGMAVYTRHAKILDASGEPVTVRDALRLINQVLDETLSEQESDFDVDSRWALTWFEQYGFSEGEFGDADNLARAKNTSVAGMVEAGVVASRKGKVRLLRPEELPADWDPASDARLTVWETVHHLIRVLTSGGETAAADMVAALGAGADAARELAYRLYLVCERKKRSAEALAYNALVQSWAEIQNISLRVDRPLPMEQSDLFE